jgi:hypothetical protein
MAHPAARPAGSYRRIRSFRHRGRTGKAEAVSQAAVDRARRPRDSPLYRLIDLYYEDFRAAYAERYQPRYGYWLPAIGDREGRAAVCPLWRIVHVFGTSLSRR